MSVSEFMARQFGRPSGLFGRVFMGRLLNRANIRGNSLIFELMAVEERDDVLEVGFGGAHLLLRVAQHVGRGSVTGVELSQPMVARAKRHTRALANVHLQHGSVDDLPFDNEVFSCVVSVNTVYFWTELQRGLTELARVSRPGARLVLGFGSNSDMRRAGYAERGFSLYSTDEISAGVETAGFWVDRVERLDQQRGAFFALRAIRKE